MSTAANNDPNHYLRGGCCPPPRTSHAPPTRTSCHPCSPPPFFCIAQLPTSPEMGYLSKASKTPRRSNYLSLLRSFNFNFNPLTNRIPHECFSMRRELFCSQSRQYSTTTREKSTIDLSQYPPELVRNFSIIAHVDHGKSTLADRLLELTGTIKKGHGQPQYLDKLQMERERGITVKAQTATMFYKHSVNGGDCSDGKESPKFLLNLIDTPGHVDFSYEVSRSLAACQGVLLVVDAAQGVQAQTVANFYFASPQHLHHMPLHCYVAPRTSHDTTTPQGLHQASKIHHTAPPCCHHVPRYMSPCISPAFPCCHQAPRCMSLCINPAPSPNQPHVSS